jgi:predicted O-methyltransferase YrrM
MIDNRLLEVINKTDIGCLPYYGMMPSLIRERDYKFGIEIGVLMGGHAKAMLDNTNLSLLIGIDPYKMYEQDIWGVEDQEGFDNIYEFAMGRLDHERYEHLRMTSDEAYSLLFDDEYDFVFIDGLHTYGQIKKDLDNYSKIIRKGGVIACHDYNHESFPLLTNAIDEFAGRHNTKVNVYEFHTIYMDKTW